MYINFNFICSFLEIFYIDMSYYKYGENYDKYFYKVNDNLKYMN